MLAALSACTSDPDTGSADSGVTDDGKIVLRFGVRFPEAAATRSIGETPDYDNLTLWCVVFQDNGAPAANFLEQVEKAERSGSTYEDDHGRLLVPFKVELVATDENAIIHFIAIDSTISAADNPLEHVDYGPENVVIPTMRTKDGHDAYWQRIALGMPIMAKNREEIEKMVSTFSPVPMIRNFAKLEVYSSTPKFDIDGFCVINSLNSGTIAPYNERYGFPQFVDSQTAPDGHRIYVPYTYDEITTGKRWIYDASGDKTPGENIENRGLPYTGARPNGWKVENKDAPAIIEGRIDPARYNLAAKYIYERPFSETEHTYIIVGGTYYPGNTDPNHQPRRTFYKIDIGELDIRGLFEFSHLLRNFNFKINIIDAATDGYDTIEEAVIGQIYNNNISAAIETQHLLNISDGNELMFVNFTSYVIVQQQELDIMYRYYQLGSDNTIDNGTQIFNAVTWDDPADGCVEGDVLAEKGTYSDIFHDPIYQGDNLVQRDWEVVHVKTKEPDYELKVQTITLFKPRGLSRTVTLFMRKPWDITNLATYSGQWDDRESHIDPDMVSGYVSEGNGENLTIFFELPQALPKAMFPLEFTIESNRQNIENDKKGTIVVKSGKSLFDDPDDGVDDIRIQYVKTVTWQEYDPDNSLWETEPDSKDDNYDEFGNYLGNIVRCRFMTITDISDLAADAAARTTTVKIVNPYFNPVELTFFRPKTD